MLDLASLNAEQREAVLSTEGPLLILAGAGTGKTRVITFRIAHLLARKVPPHHILGVTFTNKAAREMQERIAKLAKFSKKKGTDPDNRPALCTFHSLCVRILRRHIECLGFKSNFVIYDESDQVGLMRRILSRYSGEAAKIKPGEVLSFLSRIKNQSGRKPEGENPDLDDMKDRLLKEYQDSLKACNAVDFDDLILLTLKLFRNHPEALEECRERYRYVMVDEYQDTNTPQFQLVDALCKEHRNLCVVGDDDQSIYGWRGAEIANLLELEKWYPEVKIVKLEQNYRSTNVILKAANAVIKNNVRRRSKALWSAHGEGEPIYLREFENEEAEAQAVADDIELDRMARQVPWKDQAVLLRTNIQSRPLETALRQSGIRYKLVGGQSFFDRREIRDVAAYLKFFANPDDEMSLLRIANVPARGLTKTTMHRVLSLSHDRGKNVWDTLCDPEAQAEFPERTRKHIIQFSAWIDGWKTRLQSPMPAGDNSGLLAWAEGFLEDAGYWDEVRHFEKDVDAAESRILNLREFLKGLGQPYLKGSMMQNRLEAFLEEMALDSDREEEKDQGDVVTLITMHSCKGLEFPHVFIVGMEEGLLPHDRSKLEGALDEERRLFYVALTRARLTLRISFCRGRKKYGQIESRFPSSFLLELPESVVIRETTDTRRPVEQKAARSLFQGMRDRLVNE